jgi:hypothetical protein
MARPLARSHRRILSGNSFVEDVDATLNNTDTLLHSAGYSIYIWTTITRLGKKLFNASTSHLTHLSNYEPTISSRTAE